MQNLETILKSLASFLEHENAILMHKGELNINNLMGYKANLLENLNLALDMSGDTNEPALLEEITNIRSAIKLNTALQQAQNLHSETVMNGLKDKLLNNNDKEITKWH